MEDLEKSKIVVLGGNRYNLPSIQNLKENGFYTIVIDKVPNSPSFQIADKFFVIDILDYKSIIVELSKFGKINGVVSMAEVGIISAAKIAEYFHLRGNSEIVAINVTDKGQMRKCWTKIPQHSVDFVIVNSQEKGLESLSKFNFPVVVKPTQSFGGSRGIMLIHSPAEFPAAFVNAKKGGNANTEVIIETAVEGREFSAEVLIENDIISVLCIGEKIKSDFPYRVDMSVMYPAQLDVNIEKEIHQAISLAVREVGLNWGVAHIEFCLTKNNNIVFFELGARCGGGHTPLIAKHVSGVDEFVEYCNMACGLKPNNFIPKYQKSSIYRFIIFDEGEVEEVIFPDVYKNDPRILDYEIQVNKGDKIAPLINTSSRSGFLITITDFFQEALNLADEICQNILIRYTDNVQKNARIR
jgi:biotin carboxylase